MQSLLLATTNPAKARRLRWVFEGLGAEPRHLPKGAGPAPEENGASFRANAELKACFWSKRMGGLAAASDGGLCIPALGAKWDALRTARAAGLGVDDRERAEQLLKLAEGLAGEQRTAFWTEALALARDGQLIASWEADGTKAVLMERFGPKDLRPGFWAASLCYVPSLGTTLATLNEQQLAEADLTWSSLRSQVTACFASWQPDSNG